MPQESWTKSLHLTIHYLKSGPTYRRPVCPVLAPPSDETEPARRCSSKSRCYRPNSAAQNLKEQRAALKLLFSATAYQSLPRNSDLNSGSFLTIVQKTNSLDTCMEASCCSEMR